MGEQLDKKVTVYALALLFLGSLLAFVATSWSLSRIDASPWEQMSAHLEKVVLALGMCALCCATPYRRIGQLAVVGVWVSIVGLALLLMDLPFVIKSGEIPRWIDLHFFVIQPSEVAKLCLMLSLPVLIDRDPTGLRRRPKRLFLLLMPYGIVAILLAAQPNYGSILAVGLAIAGLLWAARLPVRWFVLAGALFVALGWFGFTHVSKLESRLDNCRSLLLYETEADPTGYQARQALVGLGNGGIAGAPALAMIGFLVFRALRIARETSDGLAYLMAVSIGLMISSYALLNLAMVTSLIPVIGLPLPFLSAGGSAMLTNLAGIGVLLNISATARRARSGSRWGR
jgi:cell division protein FtsW (lipid II flippase)